MNHTKRDNIRSRFNARNQPKEVGSIQARQLAVFNILEKDGNPYTYFVLTCQDCPGARVTARTIEEAKKFMEAHNGHSTRVKPQKGVLPCSVS